MKLIKYLLPLFLLLTIVSLMTPKKSHASGYFDAVNIRSTYAGNQLIQVEYDIENLNLPAGDTIIGCGMAGYEDNVPACSLYNTPDQRTNIIMTVSGITVPFTGYLTIRTNRNGSEVFLPANNPYTFSGGSM